VHNFFIRRFYVGGVLMSETINIVEAKIHLQEMREVLSNMPDDNPDPVYREKRWVLSMNIATYDMGIRKHEGTYKEPWL
jgi:hypothetical protein